jgi:molybdenum cofactor cytidylyltransferase
VIWAVILAAGESRRMGTQKLLLPFGDTTVAGAVVRAARTSRADRVLVVLGADREAVRREIESSLGGGRDSTADGADKHADLRHRKPGETTGPHRGPGRDDGPQGSDAPPRGVVFVVNEDYRLGMLSSIKTGFRALPPDAEAAVVLLGDQPFLPSGVVDEVIAAYRKGGKGIVIPTFQGRRGHPVVIDLGYRDEVLGLDPADGLRQLMRAHPGDILEAEAGDANILRDMDTPEDYKDGVKPERVRSTFFRKK